MGADVSRVRFDPRLNYSGVVHQQGRVVLDADGNEQQAMTDRRQRAAAADLGSPGPSLGVRGTAVVPRTTPDGFRPTVTGGVLTIGRGRMYVDGLLAENHGTGAVEFDLLLAGPTGGADTPYLDQPYWDTAPPLPTAGTHLVYLDVWERELTSAEESDLVDPAVAVDTTARTQVVWQVRVHAPDAPGLICATPDADIPGWRDLIAPSAGRLTVDTVEVDAQQNPCSLPPSGDFRGLENQTYRVEIHQGGAPGTATFKWSRENASITLPVTERVSANQLRLASLGKDDDVLGLKDGQWVEILDDHHEFDQQPGEIRRIVLHQDDLSISFNPALPPGWPANTAEALERHLRVRRWDQSGVVKNSTNGTVTDLDAPGSTGVIVIPTGGTAVVLENGVTVALTSPGGEFRTGDHWEFAARTGDTSVEKLTLAPPRGVHHHYARLGALSGGAIDDPDCRRLWPPEGVEGGCGDCTVCVSEEDHNTGDFTIQDAVDAVAADGGTVCLGVGTFHLQEPVLVEGVRGVHVHGQGGATLVVTPSDGFRVANSVFVTLSDLMLISSARESTDPSGAPTPAAGVRLTTCWDVTVERLTVLVQGFSAAAGREAGIRLHDLVVLSRLRDNLVDAAIGIDGSADQKQPLLLYGVTIAGNVVGARSRGIALDSFVAHAGDTEVVDNLVLGPNESGISLTGVKLPSALVSIAGNEVGTTGHGVMIGTSGTAVTDNTLTGGWDEGATTGLHGIVTAPAAVPVDAGGITQVAGNRVSGFGGHGVLLDGIVAPAEVVHNEVHDCATGVAVVCRAPGGLVHVTDNLVHDVGASFADRKLTTAVGIRVGGAERCLVAHNTVHLVGERIASTQTALGIALLGVLEARCLGNAVTDTGSIASPGAAVDYLAIGSWGFTMESNDGARRTDFDGDDDFQGNGLVVVNSERLPADPEADPSNGGRVIEGGFVTEEGSYYISVRAFIGNPARGARPSAHIGGNTLTASRFGRVANVQSLGTVTFGQNHCAASMKGDRPLVAIRADAAAVTANRATGGRPSMQLDVDPKRLTVVGNLTSSGIAPPLGAAFAPLNLDGVF